MEKKRILVNSSAGRYAIVCGVGVLRHTAEEIRRLGKFSRVHLVSSPKVWRAVGKSVLSGLGLKATHATHLMNDAETAKNLRTVEKLSRSMVRGEIDRHSLIIAVGGGVVGDVAGFAASACLRGVALVQIPTTLIAQVDSAVGGKTGVNLPEGKNLVGTFYPARLVLVDSAMLKSLPERQYRGGLAEVIKYGIIADARLFAFLEKNFDAVLRRDPAALAYIIPRSLEIKAQVVSRDERESGLREILNFGHTFGHALETITNYRTYQHGEAVAWGMMAAALLGHEIGLTPADEVSRIVSLVRRLGPLPPWPRVPPKKLIDAMHSDKKARAGKLRFVLARKIGKAISHDDVPLETLERVLHFAPHFITGGRKRRG
ncbi:MAG TPA: 3-dehydroquinate synthase [Candidatus Acidoferrum sp.]|jgi:3-dehydroquinate synthase|nr:3-dehydroquinate synthase [Candidatus Acidoferrum sp.]